MEYHQSTAENLVASLCKEIDFLRIRSKNINQSLQVCRNNELYYRLLKELRNHRQRAISIYNLTKDLINQNKESISLMFLFEISKRSIVLNKELSN